MLNKVLANSVFATKRAGFFGTVLSGQSLKKAKVSFGWEA